MRILLLIVQYPPDGNPTGRLMAQVVTGLRNHGHTVDVITALPHYTQFRIEPQYRGRWIDRERGPQGDTIRLWVYANGRKQRMLYRLISYLSFNVLAMLLGVLLPQRYDLMIAPNGSFFTGIAAAIIGWAKRAPFIYNVQDLYPEVPVQAGQLRNRYAIAGMEHLERLMYRLATHISVIAPSFRANISAKGVPHSKISLIPNFVDTDFIRPLPRHNELSAALDLDGHFVVSYAGNLGYVYDLEGVLAAADMLRDQRDILFLIVGEGVNKAALEQRASELALPNVRFLPFVPQQQLPLLRAAADLHLSPHRPGTTGYSLPSKVYEIMASGRPIIVAADPGSDVANLVEQAACGRAIPAGDPAALVDAIQELHDNPQVREQMGCAGRAYAEQHFAPVVVIDQYHQLCSQILASL